MWYILYDIVSNHRVKNLTIFTMASVPQYEDIYPLCKHLY